MDKETIMNLLEQALNLLLTFLHMVTNFDEAEIKGYVDLGVDTAEQIKGEVDNLGLKD